LKPAGRRNPCSLPASCPGVPAAALQAPTRRLPARSPTTTA
jgi:hypothetical protein